jgi:hypothetical protein
MFKGIFTSRKFWTTFLAVAGFIVTAAFGEITWHAALLDIVGVVTGYNLATGIQTGLQARK